MIKLGTILADISNRSDDFGVTIFKTDEKIVVSINLTVGDYQAGASYVISEEEAFTQIEERLYGLLKELIAIQNANADSLQ